MRQERIFSYRQSSYSFSLSSESSSFLFPVDTLLARSHEPLFLLPGRLYHYPSCHLHHFHYGSAIVCRLDSLGVWLISLSRLLAGTLERDSLVSAATGFYLEIAYLAHFCLHHLEKDGINGWWWWLRRRVVTLATLLSLFLSPAYLLTCQINR